MSQSSRPWRVALVDDQELVRAGLRMVLGAHPGIEVVGEGTDGSEVVDLVARTQPDVVLLDIRMPGVDGIEATRRVREHFGTREDGGPGILVLTTFDHDEHVVEALRAGAGGFLVKDTPVDEIVVGIGHVAAADALVGPRLTELVTHTLAVGGRIPDPAASSPTRLPELTPREHEVLELVADGLSNAEIANRLTLSEVTVKTHVGRILAKLGLRDRTQAVVHAYEAGVVHVGRPRRLSDPRSGSDRP